MNWLFLLITYLPVSSLFAGVSMLAAGFVLKKKNGQMPKGLLIAGALCIAVFVLIYGAFFLAGAAGLGPVPD